MKTRHHILAALLAAALIGADMAAAAPLPEKADMLATNTVVAQYVDTVDLPCRFMTTLCPDHCDHPTRLARFRVVTNENYEKPGKYGDEKMEADDIVTVDVKKDILGQAPEIAARIADLKPGDKVRLTITHYYVQQGQGQFPVRPAIGLELLPE